jgi:uncharacterized membrane protein
MNHSKCGILVPFSKSVALSNIVHLLIATTFDFHCSIALCCASTITCTFVSCYTSTCTFVDNYCSATITFSFRASFYIVYASTNCCSTTSSFSNSSMNIGSTNVTLGPICFFAHQHRLLMCKNSTIVVLMYLCFKLSSAQIVSSPYTPSLLHISKMTMNVAAIL